MKQELLDYKDNTEPMEEDDDDIQVVDSNEGEEDLSHLLDAADGEGEEGVGVHAYMFESEYGLEEEYTKDREGEIQEEEQILPEDGEGSKVGQVDAEGEAG